MSACLLQPGYDTRPGAHDSFHSRPGPGPRRTQEQNSSFAQAAPRYPTKVSGCSTQACILKKNFVSLMRFLLDALHLLLLID